MIVHYDWPMGEDPPAVGTYLEVSGDPDRPVLRGVIARHLEEEPQFVSILIGDGQEGAEEFQNWIATEGTLGVRIAVAQDGPV